MYVNILKMRLYKQNSICDFFFFLENVRYTKLSNGFNWFGTSLQNCTQAQGFQETCIVVPHHACKDLLRQKKRWSQTQTT